MSELNLSVENGVARLTLNRPAVLNALSPGLLNALIDACIELGANDDIRVVVLEGAGKSFSAGADLPAFHEDLARDPQATADLGRRAAEALAALPQITLAAIHGHCVGGAVVLAAACNLRVAADDSRFSIPEADAGIPLAWGGMGWLVGAVGAALAADLVLSCRPFGPAEAMQAGFLSRVIDAARFATEVSALAATVAAKPRLVLRLTKKQLVALREGNFDARDDAGALLQAMADEEARAIGERYVASRIRRER